MPTTVLVITETNAKNQTRTVTKDSQRQVVSVTDAAGKTTTYAYNPLGKLIKTTDPVGNFVTADYDVRGRKTASTDPDLGHWTYAYDTASELVSQTDAKNQTSTFSYDKLGRMTQRVEPDMTSVWTYDTAANGIGKPASATITAGQSAGYPGAARRRQGAGREAQSAAQPAQPAWSQDASHGSRAADAHLRYLERDGVTRDGEKGHAYSAMEDEADRRAFLARGRGDRHQFRFIVAPEDAAELVTEFGDLRGFTRDLMRQIEQDLDTGLDWIAVDHHNTGHPQTHIIVRGVTDDGKILNIAGDYIAHGIRHRASELVTRELGHQSEIEVAQKLATEVHTERLTRLDRMLIAEQRDHGFVDLRPGEGRGYLIRENRPPPDRPGEAPGTLWPRDRDGAGTLACLGPRRGNVEGPGRAPGHGRDHPPCAGGPRALPTSAASTSMSFTGSGASERVVGQVIGKGLASDELGERVYLVVDGVDGRGNQRLPACGGGSAWLGPPLWAGAYFPRNLGATSRRCSMEWPQRGDQ